MSRAFTPRAVDVHRPEMRATLHRLVDPIVPAGGGELMTEVADHYPIEVMCHLLGVAREDHEDFAQWNRAITWALSFQLGAHLEEVEWGLEHMRTTCTTSSPSDARRPRTTWSRPWSRPPRTTTA